ncbi:hypothetical protein HETIRDRAFT_61689 [Heterobasidion irregulare TC 32-1]|uniref:BSD domain-containing protein n=1 Tax=Heterobasidion irregulare (strain TC 32-1) TaxID=747525 RepID=W4K5F5_HETIT|nr:uncharacterized protein HETIRDRAFT_61689 [Heterobasidion irregulare TC 32-1]ETW80595.1 hypothetical protein HETIRDRAFT_61689 [Heterobasidion irregulare TC 32-1]
MPPSTLCSAKASYKKLPGLLQLTASHLQWTQDGKKAPSVRVAHVDAASLFSSKEGAAQVRLKIGLVGDDTGHNFTFTSPQPVALTEREAFKRELTTIIGRNRSIQDAAAPQAPASASVTPSAVSLSRPKLFPSSHPSSSRAASVSSDARTPGTPINDPINDFRLRKKVLVNNPELAALHRELVITGQITEAEFWDGREQLLLAQAAAESQKRGRPGQLVDPRPQTVDGGEIKIVVTPQLVHDIFEEYPVVAKAYDENVPNKLSEAEFWTRYFQSKLFNSHRASIRSTATQHVVKDDPIFDKYLEKPDDELEPRRQRDGDVEMFLDLGATNEDHGEAWNEKDITMQAGKQRGALPLIRKFNEHSERLLKSAMSEGPSAKRRRIDSADPWNYYSQIDLQDLHDPKASAGILLEMKDGHRYFEGRTGVTSAAEQDARASVDFSAALRMARNDLQEWNRNLGQLKIERKSGDAALLSMTENVATRLDVKSHKNDIPEDIFSQMRTCQTAANEFLRQFWSSIYPSANEHQLAPATPAQKNAKATRMVGYLVKTPQKVDAIVTAAHRAGVDRSKITVAMKPVLDAVDKALTFWSTRKVK